MRMSAYRTGPTLLWRGAEGQLRVEPGSLALDTRTAGSGAFATSADAKANDKVYPEADLAGGWGSANWGGKGLFPVSWRVSSGMRPLARVERSGGSADLHFLLGEEDLSTGALLR